MSIPSSLLTWTANRGVVEASDLEANGYQITPTLRVVSSKTGKSRTFHRADNILLSDDDPELVALTYKTLDGKLELHILND